MPIKAVAASTQNSRLSWQSGTASEYVKRSLRLPALQTFSGLTHPLRGVLFWGTEWHCSMQEMDIRDIGNNKSCCELHYHVPAARRNRKRTTGTGHVCYLLQNETLILSLQSKTNKLSYRLLLQQAPTAEQVHKLAKYIVGICCVLFKHNRIVSCNGTKCFHIVVFIMKRNTWCDILDRICCKTK